VKVSKFYYSPAQIIARAEHNSFYKIEFPTVQNKVLTENGWREYSDHIIEDNENDTPLGMFNDLPFYKTTDPKIAVIDKTNKMATIQGKVMPEKEIYAMESR
jgi:hypothetical protein